MTSIEAASRAFNDTAERLPVLWRLAEEFTLLLSLLEDPESDPAEIDAEMQRVAGDIKVKAYGVATVIDGLEGLAAFQKAGADKLAAKAKANQNHADRLRSYALACMKTLGIDRLETGAFTLAVRLNNPKVEVLDEQKVDAAFLRHIPEQWEVNKVAILKRFKETGEIPTGVDVVRNERLDIK